MGDRPDDEIARFRSELKGPDNEAFLLPRILRTAGFFGVLLVLNHSRDVIGTVGAAIAASVFIVLVVWRPRFVFGQKRTRADDQEPDA